MPSTSALETLACGVSDATEEAFCEAPAGGGWLLDFLRNIMVFILPGGNEIGDFKYISGPGSDGPIEGQELLAVVCEGLQRSASTCVRDSADLDAEFGCSLGQASGLRLKVCVLGGLQKLHDFRKIHIESFTFLVGLGGECR